MQNFEVRLPFVLLNSNLHKNESSPLDCFRFWNDVFRTRNVMRTACVRWPSAVMCASRVRRNTSHHFAPSAQYITMSEANNITAACRNITLYKRSKLWYNKINPAQMQDLLSPQSPENRERKIRLWHYPKGVLDQWEKNRDAWFWEKQKFDQGML